MKLKSFIGAFVALGAAALMAVGVQAATYSVGVVPAEDSGSTTVPVSVSTDATATKVSGYILKLKYDAAKVKPVMYDKDETGGDRYATLGAEFGDANSSVLVSDVITEGSDSVLVVAWASASPVEVAANDEKVMAQVQFTDVNGGPVTSNTPIDVELTALTNDGNTLEDSESVEVSDGKITLGFLYGDTDGGGTITPNDAVWVLEHIVEKRTLSADEYKRGNVDENIATLSPNDAVKILEYIVEKITSFPVENK